MIKFARNRQHKNAKVLQQLAKKINEIKKQKLREREHNSRVAHMFIGVGKLDKLMAKLFGLRKLEQGHRYRKQALMIIQKGIRMMMKRHKFLVMKKSSVKIQAFIRKSINRVRFIKMKKAVPVI